MSESYEHHPRVVSAQAAFTAAQKAHDAASAALATIVIAVNREPNADNRAVLGQEKKRLESVFARTLVDHDARRDALHEALRAAVGDTKGAK